MDKDMDIKFLDSKVPNALTAKEAKKLYQKSTDVYVEKWLPEILAEVFAHIRIAAYDQKTCINNMNLFDDYDHKDHLYKCVKTYLAGMGYLVSTNEDDYRVHISWDSAGE